MKQFLSAVLFLTSIVSYSQGGVRLFFQKPNQFYKQTIIVFTDSTTDQADNCCDAFRLIGSEEGIWTYIGHPNPLFLFAIITLICFGEIHLKSGTDLISAVQTHLLLFFDVL